MGKLISIEQSAYTTGIIDQYAQNKVGMYSKYLNLTPTFVTYYSLNQIMSRTDTGTGSVASEYGYNSPLRFNKIKGFPVYNMPVLSPDMNYDETGLSIDIDLSDITILPKTIKPTVPDFMVVEIPASDIKALFRVNNFRYNTIQSNDFVTLSLDLKELGPNIDEKINKLVVKTFVTVFENIGTEDSCFIEEENISTVNSLVDTINNITEFYHDLYWDRKVGNYILHNQLDPSNVIYDPYLNRFIDETDMMPHDATTMTSLPILDFMPVGSDMKYKKSLLYALQKCNSLFMSDKMHYYLGMVTNPHSPLILYNYHPQVVKLEEMDSSAEGSEIYEYYDKLLKSALIFNENYPTVPEKEEDLNDPDGEIPSDPNTPPTDDPNNESGEGEEIIDPENPNGENENGKEPESGNEIPDIEPGDGNEMENLDQSTTFNMRRNIKSLANGFESTEFCRKEKTDLSDEDIAIIESYTDNQIYIFNLITAYMQNKSFEIDVTKIIPPVMTHGTFSYFYTPVLIWVLKKNYDRYFTNASLNE